jgi:hypothetical protein
MIIYDLYSFPENYYHQMDLLRYIKLSLGITFFIILFMIKSNDVRSQSTNDSIRVLDGVILTADSLLPIHNAHIISKFNKWGTISNQEGRFKLYVQNNDSILITSIGFRPIIVQMDNSFFVEDSVVPIYIPKDTISINEVVIRGYFDYATMKQIVIEMRPIDLTQFYPDWSGTELLYKSPQPMSFKGPIQALYDVFNNSARLQRKLIKNRREYNRVMTQMGRANDTIPATPEHMQELPY